MPVVERQTTPLSPLETVPHFVAGFDRVFGRAPSREQAEWLWTLLANENNEGKAIVNYNWGNLSTSGEPHLYWEPPWVHPAEFEALPDGPKKERYRHEHENMLAGKAPKAFRAFTSHQEGAHAWFAQLKRRYQRILDARSARAMQDAVYQSGYCNSEPCSRNWQRYELLHTKARALGLFAHLRSEAFARRTTSSGALFFSPLEQEALRYG
jgi:hypothetical protein